MRWCSRSGSPRPRPCSTAWRATRRGTGKRSARAPRRAVGSPPTCASSPSGCTPSWPSTTSTRLPRPPRVAPRASLAGRGRAGGGPATARPSRAVETPPRLRGRPRPRLARPAPRPAPRLLKPRWRGRSSSTHASSPPPGGARPTLPRLHRTAWLHQASSSSNQARSPRAPPRAPLRSQAMPPRASPGRRACHRSSETSPAAATWTRPPPRRRWGSTRCSGTLRRPRCGGRTRGRRGRPRWPWGSSRRRGPTGTRPSSSAPRTAS
mmetsp:Transcript_3893/g.9237  ORF Transcript_3893/g.9237 Transcript_3893/m.9237 type:complete len:265 (-) Transcript_3893:641-1435(-)